MSTLKVIPVVNDGSTWSVKVACCVLLAVTVAPPASHDIDKAFVAFDGIQLAVLKPSVMLEVPLFQM